MGCYEKMIPSPKMLCDSDVYCLHGGTIGGDFESAIEIFRSYAKKAHGIEFSQGDSIVLCADSTLEAGEYRITSHKDSVKIWASDSEGASYALASLLQLMENEDGCVKLPVFDMRDKANNDYRGLMIDCARNHHPVSLLKKYTDLCWLYKIKYLHLHLTDDQAYTLPSKRFPSLTTPHNCYSEEEIAELVQYAYERDVQIVPEIDTPGHSRIIREAYPETLGKGCENIICFHPENIETMQDIYRELCHMFPHSSYIHIGADESSIMEWNDCPECVSFGESLGIIAEEFEERFYKPWHRAERFLVHYINKMAEVIIDEGRMPLVWEGFSDQVNKYADNRVSVMVFESLYQLASSYVKNGFNVINCSWRPTYVVVPDYFWGKDQCYNWDVGTYSAVHPQSPYYGGYFRMDSKDGTLGGQLNAWGDFLGKYENGPEMELEKIREDLPAIAENTWNNEKRGDYMHFLACHKHCEEIATRIIS